MKTINIIISNNRNNKPRPDIHLFQLFYYIIYALLPNVKQPGQYLKIGGPGDSRFINFALNELSALNR